MSETEEQFVAAIADLNRRMLSALMMPPHQLGPEPLRCPACGKTRMACVAFYGHDVVHDEEIRAALGALGAVSGTLRDWPPDVGPPAEWDSSRYLPGGDRYIPKLMIYGTPVSLTSFIPMTDPEEIARRERETAAGKALAVLREAETPPNAHRGRVRRLKAEPWPADGEGRANAALPARVESGPSAYSVTGPSCPSCVLAAPRRLPPLGFPLMPLSAA